MIESNRMQVSFDHALLQSLAKRLRVVPRYQLPELSPAIQNLATELVLPSLLTAADVLAAHRAIRGHVDTSCIGFFRGLTAPNVGSCNLLCPICHLFPRLPQANPIY